MSTNWLARRSAEALCQFGTRRKAGPKAGASHDLMTVDISGNLYESLNNVFNVRKTIRNNGPTGRNRHVTHLTYFLLGKCSGFRRDRVN
jgi:hypothetical protein